MDDFRETRSLRSEQDAEKRRQAKLKLERKRAQTRRLIRAAMALALAAAAIVVGQAMLGPVRLSPLTDAWRLTGRRGEGFPLDFGYSHTRQSARVGKSLALLGSTQLEIITSSGYESLSEEQPYTEPSICAAGGRVALFDRASGKLTLFSRTGELYKKDLFQPIYCVSLSKNGALAAATKSDGATCEVTAFDAKEKQRFAWRCEKEYPGALRLADDGRALGVCLIGTEQAGVYARFAAFSFGRQEPRTDLKIPGAWLYGASAAVGGWLAVGDQAVYFVRHGAKEPKPYSYEGRALDRFDMENDGYCAVLLADWENQSLVRVYDKHGRLALESGFRQKPLGLACEGGAVYLRFEHALLRWQKGVGLRQSPLPQGAQEAVVAGRDAFVLTLREAELARLQWGPVEDGLKV